MAMHPKVFVKMFVYMVEAGEASGKLDTSMSRMNEYYEREYKLRKEVVGAMVYPSVIFTAAIGALIFLMTTIVPIFVQIFKESGTQLPLITQVLFVISDLMRSCWFVIPIVVIGGIVGYRMMRKNSKGSEMLDKFWLKVPLFGDLLRKLAVTRFTRTLATLLDSGVPVLQSLEIVQKAVSNAVIAQGIRQATLSISRGTGLAKPLQDSGIFPAMVSQTVSIGEETGDLAHMLNEVADYYDKEVGYAVDNLTSMLEPIIIIFVGGVVALIVAAIMLPMFQLSSGSAMGM
jgi:type IV pilus assembly protein PilC